MTLIGASAIEDKLQDNLRETIEQLRMAKMKIWVLTGDKMETARNIAISSRLFDPEKPIMKFESVDDIYFYQGEEKSNLLISGELFGRLYNDKSSELERLKQIIMEFECVVFCRANANQKVQIVQIVKDKGKIVLAIGDGANDVNMIQEANVGIGIIGQEGQQAANAADFAID